jgi:anti-anti-sigma factor
VAVRRKEKVHDMYGIECTQYDSYSVITLPVEEMDFIKTPKISAAIQREIEEVGYPNIALELPNLYYIDSTGMSSIINMSRTMKEKGRELVLVCGSPRIIQIFGIAKIGAHLRIFGSLEDAERYFINRPSS